jgi:hypothetical protein
VFNFIEVKHRTRFGALVFFFPVVSLFFFSDLIILLLCCAHQLFFLFCLQLLFSAPVVWCVAARTEAPCRSLYPFCIRIVNLFSFSLFLVLLPDSLTL